MQTLCFRYETGGRPRHRIWRTIVALFLQFQWVSRDGRNGIKFAWFWATYSTWAVVRAVL
jgi:hypothetical protein